MNLCIQVAHTVCIICAKDIYSCFSSYNNSVQYTTLYCRRKQLLYMSVYLKLHPPVQLLSPSFCSNTNQNSEYSCILCRYAELWIVLILNIKSVWKMSLLSTSLLSVSFWRHMDAKIKCQWILFNLGLYSFTRIEPLRGLDTPH